MFSVYWVKVVFFFFFFLKDRNHLVDFVVDVPFQCFEADGLPFHACLHVEKVFHFDIGMFITCTFSLLRMKYEKNEDQRF